MNPLFEVECGNIKTTITEFGTVYTNGKKALLLSSRYLIYLRRLLDRVNLGLQIKVGIPSLNTERVTYKGYLRNQEIIIYQKDESECYNVQASRLLFHLGLISGSEDVWD